MHKSCEKKVVSYKNRRLCRKSKRINHFEIVQTLYRIWSEIISKTYPCGNILSRIIKDESPSSLDHNDVHWRFRLQIKIYPNFEMAVEFLGQINWPLSDHIEFGYGTSWLWIQTLFRLVENCANNEQWGHLNRDTATITIFILFAVEKNDDKHIIRYFTQTTHSLELSMWRFNGIFSSAELYGSWQIVTLSCVLRTQTAYVRSQRLNIRYMKIVPIFKEWFKHQIVEKW